jgi:hypothetical protein
MWQRFSADQGTQVPIDLAIDGDGDVIVAGNFNTRLSLGNLQDNNVNLAMFLVGLDAKKDGALTWARQIGQKEWCRARAITATKKGHTVVGELAGTAAAGKMFTTAGKGDLLLLSFGP